ncbi:hypothetical protein [Flavobacterium sp.]|uniref:hypothetical protein n=1 Tax=Flavobacterium sp. TaxID=239 RepID=UPI00260EEC79|nr:hypothetical protein [Flavobacterium sp.]
MPQLEIYRNNALVEIKKCENLTEARKLKNEFISQLKSLGAKQLSKQSEFFFTQRKKI